ncbi:hypothetical protein [Paenarthrobacter sp. PH39-S1]|uniref:hypothetical protein n=1 Tax=Paenarthrobacter sp. PH39-S1 TaxID=3046204 RepID=UPI0024B968FE|nr:hypothetical protein [Paenarthrobacter sp. PH39-S1]MDJ0358547.1 hypothetical protein [Paenarthrobacter sp. PH39-S1]
MSGIRGEDLWRVPAVAQSADRRLIAGLRSLADRSYELADEMLALPVLPAHGAARPQNLPVESTGHVRGGSTNFALIGWGLFGGACAGFDLGQLLAGWVNQGTMAGASSTAWSPYASRCTAKAWPSLAPTSRKR